MPLPRTIGTGRTLMGRAAVSSLLTSLVGYWTMNETSGDRADSSGSGFTLTDNATVTSAAGKIGNAAEFTAANSEYLSIADQAALRGGARDFSFDGWIYVPTPATAQEILGKGSATSGANLEYRLFVSGSNLQWRMSAGATITTLLIGAVSANTWTYFCAWYEVATGLLWGQINNNAAVSSALVGTPNTVAQPFRIGTSPALSLYLTGMVDEIGRWNRILTGTERASRYNSGSGLALPF